MISMQFLQLATEFPIHFGILEWRGAWTSTQLPFSNFLNLRPLKIFGVLHVEQMVRGCSMCV